MIHARRRSDGSLYEGSHREATYPDDVQIDRLWGMGEVVMACGEECEADHAKGRCVIRHEALIAKREQERADEAKIQAELRAMALERIAAR